jgi:protoporphyrinogen oxidase
MTETLQTPLRPDEPKERAAAAIDGETLFDVAVLGCGVSGLALARMLSRQGERVVVIESYGRPGGNHLSFVIRGMEFDVGTIYFSEGDLQFRYFPELLAVCIHHPVTVQKVNRTGWPSRYPFSLSDDVLRRGPLFMARALLSLFWDKLRIRRPRTAGDRIRQVVGSFFFVESGVAAYIRRMFGADADALAPSFIDRRMAWLLDHRLSAILARALRRGRGRPQWTSELALFRPAGGFARYYDIAVDALAAEGVRFVFAETLQAIGPGADEAALRIDGASRAYRARRVISTLPLRQLCAITGIRQPDLATVTLVTLMVSFLGAKRASGDVIYNLDQRGPWKRITMMSNIYGRVDGREYMSVECPIEAGAAADIAGLYATFVAHVQQLRLFTGDFRLEGSNCLAEAYPVMATGYEAERERVLAEATARGIETAGRQGRFEYIPHSSVAFHLIEERFGHGAADGPRTVPANDR